MHSIASPIRCAIVCALGLANAAQAAEPSAASAVALSPSQEDRNDGAGDLSEVIVTAQRRSERLRDVPLSIAVVTGESIKQQGISSLEDVTSRIAGVGTSRDGTQSSFSIRGIQSSAGSDPTSATAGLYIDDYPLYDTWFRFSTPDPRMVDIERIEVLRGPQGTLYGATSLSGSIRIITNKPDLGRYEAQLSSSLADTASGAGSYDLSGVVNIPLVDGIAALRAVAYSREDGGYVDNPLQGRTDTNTQHTQGGRLALRVRPDDSLNLLASVSYQRSRQDDQSATLYSPPPGASPLQWRSWLPSRVQSDLLIASLNAEKQTSRGVVSLTGVYGRNDTKGRFDATPAVFLFGGGLSPTLEDRPSLSTTKILEARYASDANKQVRFVVGAYYNSRFRKFRQDASAPSLVAVGGTPYVYQTYGDQRSVEYAVFGESTVAFSDRVEGTLGLRVFRNAYHFYGDTKGLIISLADPLTSQITDASNNSTSYIPRVSLSYKLTPNANLYATASKGYRFGLTNYNSDSRNSIPLPYKSDTLWNYEIGEKASFLDGKASANLALYYIAWSDLQLPFRNASNLIYTTNAGDARSYGLEVEASFRPVRSLELNAAVSVGDAQITRGNPNVVRRGASARGPAVIGIVKGDRLPGSQAFNASVGVQHTWQDVGRGDVFVRADDIYAGSSYSDFMKDGALKAGGYNLVNLRIGYRTRQFELVAYVDNLTNSDGIVSALSNADLLGADAAFRVRRRTLGVTFRANLGS